MIATPPRTVPVPDAVASLSGRQLPDRVLDAADRAAEAVRLYTACRGPQYAEARQRLEARIARANKTLVARPGDLPGIERKER